MGDTLSFGEWLRLRRRSRDLTQVELANLVQCAVGTLRNIEADDARPSKQLAARLARALGVPGADVDAVVAFARGTGSAPVDNTPAPGSAQPLALSQSPRSNVPAQLTHLIGRAEAVGTVRELLLRPGVRLVTLTGPGGIGKTRVAVEVAVQLVDAFGDGVSFVDLSAITDAELVSATIAQTVGTPESVPLTLALREQARLLVLDNFEQVVGATPTLVELLNACRHVKVLVTSRIALDTPGEFEWPIPPLALPDLAHLPPLDQLSQYEAVRLFVERARAANPEFTITSSNAPAVAEICYQLDGLPLTIELAAARVKLFAPQALLARLDRRLDFLTGGGRTRPPRQQTIRNTIDWSYQLLTPSEQSLLQRLSVFVDGGTLAAIEAVCGDGELTDSVLDDVAALTNHSLLRRLPPALAAADADTDPRFGMLETIREYAAERLATSGDATTVRQRHAHYFAALAETAAAEWETPRINAAIARQRREHNNLRGALQWSVDTRDTAVGLRLAIGLWGFWRSYGYSTEGRAWFEQLLRLDEHPTDPALLAARQRALDAAAWLASDQHDYAAAIRFFEEGATLRRALGRTESSTALLINAARQARMEGNYERSAALLEEALARRGVAGGHPSRRDPTPQLTGEELGQILRELGLVLREQGDFVRAVALLEEGLALALAHHDRVSAALAMLGLGDIARDQGDGPEVRRYCEPSLAVFREFGMQWAIGFTLNTLALGACSEGALPRAAALIRESVTLFRDLRADASVAEVLLSQGKIQRLQGDTAAAQETVREALQLAHRAPRLFVAAGLEELASIVAERGQADRTVRLLSAAHALREQMGAPVRPADRNAVDLAQATARATLDEATFAAMWDAAKERSLEQVLESTGEGA